ncbi:hypothetical protein DFH08DRAFT_819786 [Mycena albidolilacea]|uniref:Uncharacterized protein n=1 Tax=Mycena albidolilacea TaxID=1033008 RepID=A0AAD7EEM1_9AGAR|nr:hypothetical protein DFH08DRAFT_819786 [Mycena albidolilacea]
MFGSGFAHFARIEPQQNYQERVLDDARFAARARAIQESASTVTSKARPLVCHSPISRTATPPVIGNEEELAPAGKGPAIDLSGRDNSIAVPDAVVTWKLVPPPVMKDSKKEISTAPGIHTSSNTTILADHVVAMQQKHASLALDLANMARRIEGKIAHAPAKEPVDVMADITEITQLNNDIARHSISFGRIECEEARLHDTLTVLEAGNGGCDIVALKDGQARCTNVDEDYATLVARVDTLVAVNNTLVLANNLLEECVAVLEAKPPKKDRELENQVLEVGKSIAELQLTTMKKVATTSGDNDAEGLIFDLGTARKGSVAPDAETSSSEHPKVPVSVGEKADYKYWVQMAPIATNVAGSPASSLKRIVIAAFVDGYNNLPKLL